MAKTQMISDAQWNLYKKIINDFMDVDTGKAPIVWRKHINQPSAYGEDSNSSFIDISLNVLIAYNYFRTWPLDKGTISGESDEQSSAIWVSARYLNELGYLKPSSPSDSQYYWDFNPGMDRFILNGITYKASGDTQVAQAKDEALLFMIVIKREELND